MGEIHIFYEAIFWVCCMYQLDVTIVSGRRPELLEETMKSFHRGLFQKFDIKNVYVNIDPFGGSETAQVECVKIIKSFFPHAHIAQPDVCSFTKAVQTLWMRPSSRYFLHLEDDWTLNEPIDADKVDSMLTGNVKQVSLMSVHKGWDGRSLYHKYKKRKKFRGITYWRSRSSDFSTSPVFIDSKFAKECASRMKVELDPEKQFSENRNPVLESYSSQYLNKFYVGEVSPNVVSDTGRKWRKQRGIEKIFDKGVTSWQTHETIERKIG